MKKTRLTREQTTVKIREVEVELARGGKISQVCRQIRVTEQTFASKPGLP